MQVPCEALPVFTDRCILPVVAIHIFGHVGRGNPCLPPLNYRQSQYHSTQASKSPFHFKVFRDCEFTTLSSKLSMLRFPVVSTGCQQNSAVRIMLRFPSTSWNWEEFHHDYLVWRILQIPLPDMGFLGLWGICYIVWMT